MTPGDFQTDSAALAVEIKRRARAIGFDLVGIASARPSDHASFLRQWLDAGKAGAMEYIARRYDERVDLQNYLPGAQSVVCVALNYHVPTADAPQPGTGRIARYALGDDYHERVKPMVYALADWIRETVPGSQTRAGVDTVPLLERELAARAGIGWIGKNTCIIHPSLGSWLFLAEIVTDLPLPTDTAIADHCGTCTRCIDACPTQAIVAPRELDARRCISYLTIEHRDDIDPELADRMGDWIYGCDVCQEVCPHNRRVEDATAPFLQSRFPAGSLPTEQVLQWSAQDFAGAFRRSAVRRVKLPQLQRNARIAQKNAGATTKPHRHD